MTKSKFKTKIVQRFVNGHEFHELLLPNGKSVASGSLSHCDELAKTKGIIQKEGRVINQETYGNANTTKGIKPLTSYIRHLTSPYGNYQQDPTICQPPRVLRMDGQLSLHFLLFPHRRIYWRYECKRQGKPNGEHPGNN